MRGAADRLRERGQPDAARTLAGRELAVRAGDGAEPGTLMTASRRAPGHQRPAPARDRQRATTASREGLRQRSVTEPSAPTRPPPGTPASPPQRLRPAPRFRRLAGRLAALTETARGGSRSRGHRRVQRVLVVSELALALVLTVSGPIDQQFHLSHANESRIRHGRHVKMKLRSPLRRTRSSAAPELLRRCHRTGAHAAGRSIGRRGFAFSTARLEHYDAGRRRRPSVGRPEIRRRSAHGYGDYFAAMGIPILEGRSFSAKDIRFDRTTGGRGERAAARRCSAGSPVGRRAQLGGNVGPLFTVVGVVGDVYDASLRSSPRPQAVSAVTGSRAHAGALRGPLAPVMNGVRRAVAAMDRTLPLYDVQTIEEVVQSANRADQFTTLVLSVSPRAHSRGARHVWRHRAECGRADAQIGVRRRSRRGRDVLTMVLGEGLVLLAIALPLPYSAMATSRALDGLLFESGQRSDHHRGGCAHARRCHACRLLSAGTAPARRSHCRDACGGLAEFFVCRARA